MHARKFFSRETVEQIIARILLTRTCSKLLTTIPTLWREHVFMNTISNNITTFYAVSRIWIALPHFHILHITVFISIPEIKMLLCTYTKEHLPGLFFDFGTSNRRYNPWKRKQSLIHLLFSISRDRAAVGIVKFFWVTMKMLGQYAIFSCFLSFVTTQRQKLRSHGHIIRYFHIFMPV